MWSRLQQLAELHSKMLNEDQMDGDQRAARLRDVRAAVQASCEDGAIAAGELLALLDREADLLSRRARRELYADLNIEPDHGRWSLSAVLTVTQGPQHQLKPAQPYLQRIAAPCSESSLQPCDAKEVSL